MRRPFHLALAAAAASLLLLVPGTAPAANESAGLSDDDLACLKCHDRRGFEQKLADGKPRALYVSTEKFAASVHRKDGCAACHSETEDDCEKKKPGERAFKTRREHSVGLMKGCIDCHKGSVLAYEDSVHAALLKKPGDKADKTALCSDCHGSHTEQFFEAAIKCESCHKESVKEHRDWLPKAERHLETVACEACHAPAVPRRVNLRLYVGASPLAVRAGVPQFQKAGGPAGAQTASLDSRALLGLLKELSEEGAAAKTVLRGRLELRSQEEGHRLAEKGKAIKDCAACHREGAEAFRSVMISVVGPDGKTLQAPADQKVLSSLASLDSVGGFYVLGASRIKLLDTLLLLVFVGGTAGPLTHLSLRALARRIREKRAARERGEAKDG